MKYILVAVIVLALGGISFFPPVSIPQNQSQDKGIGPVKELKLGPVDKKLAAQGQQLFSAKCVACHSLDQKIIGPPLRNVTKTRTPEYIMNMILNPANMEKGDPVTKELHKKYIATPMTDQGLTQDQARSILEYLRSSEK
jgi:mono/diheme cytochrome c family protein